MAGEGIDEVPDERRAQNAVERAVVGERVLLDLEPVVVDRDPREAEHDRVDHREHGHQQDDEQGRAGEEPRGAVARARQRGAR